MNISAPPATDISLTALKAGDRAEFARLVDAYYPLIYRLGLKMLGDAQDAEDILQETFIKALRYIGGFDGRSSLSTWLYRIAANEALMLIRKRRPSASLDEPQENDEGLQEPVQIVDWCCMPEEELLTTETRQHLDEAIQRLPPSLRVVFVLRELQGLSTGEAAEALGLSENALKTRLSRARLRLREDLSGYFGARMSDGREMV